MASPVAVIVGAPVSTLVLKLDGVMGSEFLNPSVDVWSPGAKKISLKRPVCPFDQSTPRLASIASSNCTTSASMST